MSLDSVRQQEQNSVFVLSASKILPEKSDFSRIALMYLILKSKNLLNLLNLLQVGFWWWQLIYIYIYVY